MEEHRSETTEAPTEPPRGDDTWLLVAVSTAGAAGSLRVHVWRKLRGLGAVYLQQSVCLLPDRPQVFGAVRQLVAKVNTDGGSARCLHMRIDDPVERDGLIGEFRQAVTTEYGEALEQLFTFRTEAAEGRAAFAEAEESEADLARCEAQVAKIQARDYFDAPIGAEVRAELERARVVMRACDTARVPKQPPSKAPPRRPRG
ncbi:hypothetical protein LHJ74_19360 [Streptomyces sp. N2-109]|uniref:ChrB N-terminal domain-containing protein n=1 Tax=Streptomyces gossypii TaxID=2883101 RepID=A0ABT2JVU7_9ACTN|nr:Chromate resistance protein ChrB [Streptomyces gossypii]MCT2592034.1 hypothetical protein [Streptomyces gossypii]